jgi:ATP-binding cassette subfamily F protein 3
MSLITTHSLGKSFGPNDIFSGVSQSIPPRARIAIVGPNGIGKTTLLRILVGLEDATSGRVLRAKGIEIGYLPQEAALEGSHTLWQECLNALADLLSMESDLKRLEAAMSDPQQAQDAMHSYGKLQQIFEHKEGYTYETRIRQTLSGLGFEGDDYHRPLTQLSGGQRTRALLARLLLSDPDLLVLDEPTNHLDIQAVEWLEGYLSQWQGAALIVSHDRYFLDKVVDHIWEMSQTGMETYRGNYSAYLQHRQERWALRQQSYEDVKLRLEKDLDYIKRNIAGQNTLQAKGRLKRLSRTLDAIDKGGVDAIQDKKWSEISDETGAKSQMMTVDEVTGRIRSLRNPITQPTRLNLNLKANRRSGDLTLRTRDLVIGYADDGQPLFTVPDLVFKRTECAALIGPNGAGKTTFLKTLLGKLPPLGGEIILGASLDVAYFAQAHEDLNPALTLVEEIESVKSNMLLAEIRDYLARFLFTGEDVFKPVSMLSGGERGRLALAKLALSNANLLLLDEPTNHLDIPSQEILQAVLSDYQGTILLVSHDRYLIDALATQIWEIEPGQDEMRVFEGGYSEYRNVREMEMEKQASKAQPTFARQELEHKKRQNNQDKRRQRRLEQLELEIELLENRLAALSRQLENPPSDPHSVQSLGEQYVEVQSEINTLVGEWGQLQEEALRG